MRQEGTPSSQVLLNAKLNLLGESPAFLRLLGQIDRFARCDATVLINGETGTGKELTARAIHYLSGRATGRSSPSIAVRCPIRCSAASSSATRAAPSPMRTRTARDSSRRPKSGTLFLDELEALSRAAKSRCCASCRTTNTGRSGGARSRSRTCG